MVVVHGTKGGTYILAELNGAVSKLRYVAFRVIHYLARFLDHIPVTSLLDETSWRMFSFILKAFHQQMTHLMTRPLMIEAKPLPLLFQVILNMPQHSVNIHL